MAPRTLLFLHGFASSDKARKTTYLRERLESEAGVRFHAVNYNPTPTDFEWMTPTGMIDRTRQAVLDHGLEPLSLICSSLGALIGTHYAHRYGNVSRLLLLAPLLRWPAAWDSAEVMARWEQEGSMAVPHYALPGRPRLRFDFHADGRRYGEWVPPAAPTVILHSRDDSIVPIADSRAYAGQFPDRVRLLELETAGHDLNDHLPAVWEQVQSLIAAG